MDIGASPPLTCCFFYIYLSPSSTGLFSSSFSEEQGTKRGDGLRTGPRVRPVTRSPGHRGWSSFALPLKTWVFWFGPGLLALSLPGEAGA